MTDELDVDLPDEEQDLYEHHRIVVDKGQSPLRIDKFLMIRIENTIRNKIQNAAHAGNILVNDKPVKPNYKVKPGDIISVVMAYPPRETEIAAENIPLNIVYEDADILIVNKMPEMVVHPGFGNFSGTLVNALAYHFQTTDSESKPYLVHRIDKNTSGLLLVAKNEVAQSFLAKQFYDHTVERKYWALVWGDFLEDEGTITGNVGRSLKDRKVMTVFPDGDYGKHAVTHYKVLERFGYVTLVECVLETGRTHQIRAHMRYLKHPLFNDEVYGGNQIIKGTIYSKYKQYVQNCFNIIPRQALHAKTLGFIHPSTKKMMAFDSEMPADFGGVLDKWRNYSQYNTIDDEE
ncbi:MAG: RluA family pseudouridine synthase [Bacteroidales bacterium]|jgi:23S rRNA pseudouridine1911/1915/1917 synthase|nr:RluA family pseudouridine synthase [Bacteroidales bacterium]